MKTPLALVMPRHKAFFRTPTWPVPPLRQPVAMPAWRSWTVPPEQQVMILAGPGRGLPADAADARRTHSYGAHGASALCGTAHWQELVPPDEATCPACRARLGRASWVRVH